MKKWQVKIIHFSHTDIGYTDTQEHIIGGQVTNLFNIVDKFSKSKKNKELANWRWTCESFYIVERFLKVASPEEIEIFSKLVKSGIVSLSASYLNLCELASSHLFGNVLARCKAICAKRGWKLDSAVCNDVNGMSKGFGIELGRQGIKNLYFGLHTHHGFYPAWKKQSPFWWKNGKDKVLVWIGEHYMMGNELGLIDGAMGDYILQSNFEKGPFSETKQVEEGATRIIAYLQQLELDGYPFSIVPITVLGANTDNAPANFSIVERIQRLNAEFAKRGQSIELQMSGISDFFDSLPLDSPSIPVYAGDWPDWWSDGVGSTPQATRLFREAQRQYEAICKLGIRSDKLEDLEEKLMLFAEHTWGGWSSVENPFSLWQQELIGVKKGYAAQAFTLAQTILGEHWGQSPHLIKSEETVSISATFPWVGSSLIPILLNPYLTNTELEEFSKGCMLNQDGKHIDSVLISKPYLGFFLHELYALATPKNVTEIAIRKSPPLARPMTRMFSTKAADGISDVHNPLNGSTVIVSDRTLKNDFLTIKWNDKGIFSLINNATGEELIGSDQEPLFCPVYEVGSSTYDRDRINATRRVAGRNHRTRDMQRSAGKLISITVLSEAVEATEIELLYELPGTKMYKVDLLFFNKCQLINAKVQIIKDSSWAPESLFISLPFANDAKIRVEKGGTLEIWKDQIPGSLIDYYCVQSGLEITTKKDSRVLLASPDSPLFWTGPQYVEKRFLAHDSRNPHRPVLYSWVMNSMWETNFSAELGGFHEFRYTLAFGRTKEAASELKSLSDSYFVVRKQAS